MNNFDEEMAQATVAEGTRNFNKENRRDDRTDDEMVENVNTRNDLEDAAADHIAEVSNSLDLGFKMKNGPIGVRQGLIENHKNDVGDEGFDIFGSLNGFVVVEMKLRDFSGTKWRPKVLDADKHITKNRPMLLVMNHGTSYASLVLIVPDDLKEIQSQYSPICWEIREGKKWSPYAETEKNMKNKPYYLVPGFWQYPYVLFSDLTRDGGPEAWKYIVQTLLEYKT